MNFQVCSISTQLCLILAIHLIFKNTSRSGGLAPHAHSLLLMFVKNQCFFFRNVKKQCDWAVISLPSLPLLKFPNLPIVYETHKVPTMLVIDSKYIYGVNTTFVEQIKRFFKITNSNQVTSNSLIKPFILWGSCLKIRLINYLDRPYDKLNCRCFVCNKNKNRI